MNNHRGQEFTQSHKLGRCEAKASLPLAVRFQSRTIKTLRSSAVQKKDKQT